MAPFNPVVASFDFIHAPNLSEAARQFLVDRSVILHFFQIHWQDFLDWLSQPSVHAVIIAWVVTFTAVTLLILGLGFGPAGVVAGSAAAAFQAWMYGGFTPAAGIFAALTSLAMLGLLMPVVAIFAAFVATVVAVIVWVSA